MDGGMEDQDGDVLSPFFTVSPPHSSSSSYSQNFAFSPLDDLPFIHNDAVASNTIPRHNNLNLLDDDDAVFTSVSQNYPAAPRVFDRFDSSSTASEENDEFYRSDAGRNEAVQRLDYMIDYLDRKLADDDVIGSSCSKTVQAEESQPLPEFSAEGGGTGIFRLPVRSAMNPDRPMHLEMRPHPLRERQIGRFLRNIVCVDDGRQMWAGSECGLRAWDLGNIYGAGAGAGAGACAGACAVACTARDGEAENEHWEEEGECEGCLEEDTVPYVESVRTVGTLCVVGDDGYRVVWSGHRDGKIRCWKMDGISDSGKRFTEGLSWQAHRGPVLSMVMSAHGKI